MPRRRSQQARQFDSRRRERRRRRDAQAVWKSLDGADQEQVLREIIETRADELRKAYPDIIEIGMGYATTRVRTDKFDAAGSMGSSSKQRRTQRPRTVTRLKRSLHLIFIVKQKISDTPDVPQRVRRRFLPRELLAYVTRDGVRVLCAVPTDVKCSSAHRFAVDAAKEPAVRGEARGLSMRGTICCVVKDPITPERLHALCCHHVFCLSKILNGPPPDRRVLLLDGNTLLGRPELFGILKGGLRFSLDGALVDYDPQTGVHGPPYLPGQDLIAQNLSQVPDAMIIRTPRRNSDGGRVRVRFVDAFPATTLVNDYHHSYGRPIVHEELIKLQITSTQGTEPGDSGSPVFDAEMNRLVGMHIAGQHTQPPRRLVRGEFTLMIPTYVLLRARLFGIAVPEQVLFHLHL